MVVPLAYQGCMLETMLVIQLVDLLEEEMVVELPYQVGMLVRMWEIQLAQ